jgi:hypothetical protein
VDERFANFPALSKAIRELYRLFGRYPFRTDRHRDCFSAKGGPRFYCKRLEEFSGEDLRWCLPLSNVEDFKHFLPRLCELAAIDLITPITVPHDSSVSLWDLCVEFRYTQWHTWPNREQSAVHEFFLAFFNASLGMYPGERPEEHVRDMGETGVDVAILLHLWGEAKGLNAALQLSDVISTQADNLFRLGGVRLGVERGAEAIDERFTAWLARPERRMFLEEVFFQHPDGRNAEDMSDAIRTYDLWREAVANKA